MEAFVPGGYDSGTGRIAIPVGQAALYLAIPLGLLFYVRHRIGPRTWRVLHRCVIVVYVLSVWHTLLYGTNVWYDGWFRTSVWLLQLPIAALLLLRLLRPARRSEKLSLAGRAPGNVRGGPCDSRPARRRGGRGGVGRRGGHRQGRRSQCAPGGHFLHPQSRLSHRPRPGRRGRRRGEPHGGGVARPPRRGGRGARARRGGSGARREAFARRRTLGP
ncbi:hypothetical protein SCALM49S_05631 [Streptomyces californicus]